MKNTSLYTTTGNAYWHFHPIGVGVIITYNIKTMQIIMTCEHTGQVKHSKDFYSVGGLTQAEFRGFCADFYIVSVDNGLTVSLDYMDDPTIVGCIGVDLELIKN